jgi:hypothetical protein
MWVSFVLLFFLQIFYKFKNVKLTNICFQKKSSYTKYTLSFLLSLKVWQMVGRTTPVAGSIP